MGSLANSRTHSNLSFIPFPKPNKITSASPKPLIISDGGLAVAVAESCILNQGNPIGAKLNLTNINMRPEWFLFSESQSRIIISVKPDNQTSIETFFNNRGINISKIGYVGGDILKINDWISIPLSDLQKIYFTTIHQQMEI